MIKKLIRQMLVAGILSALTVSLCLLIDSIIIGQYLGVGAVAAYSIANPILLIIGAIGSALSAGVQVVCSKALGRGDQEATNAGFSSAIGMALAFSIPFMTLVLVFSAPVSRILGAKTQELFLDTRGYIRGFIIGAPATMGALILVPFLQMAGKTGLLIASVGAMTVIDIVLDVLNVTVFHGGMFGMGLASSLSYYAALLVGGTYFVSKKCFFKFSFKRISTKKMKELVVNSIPAVFNMAASVILVFAMNRILLRISGELAVAAFSAISTVGNASNCITTGIAGVSLTLTGIFYNEEDRTSLRVLVKEMAQWSVILGAFVGMLLMFFAPYAVSLFIKDSPEARRMAIYGLRIYALGLIPCCMNGGIKNALQGSGRERYTELISMLEGAVCPILVTLLLTAIFGTKGAWFFFFLGELLTLAVVFVIIRVKTGKPAWKDLNVLMLPEDFSVRPEEMMEVDIQTIEEVEKASEAIFNFCRTYSQDRKLCHRIAVCVEEMAANVVQHGFTKDDKEHQLSVRLIHKNGQWTLRFRDDCRAFDPIHYVPTSPEKAERMGIRLVLGLADDIRYTYSMSLNNLMIILHEKAAGAE